jgi:CO/xanthine dehydrogenase Mo-binding subunit
MTVEAPVKGGIGESVRRPDGIPKVKGDFAYSSDLWAEGMLWGATLRSPHPRARTIVAALRAATGAELTRVPVRPDDIVGL